MTRILVGLGANLGPARQTLTQAVEELAQLPRWRLLGISGWVIGPPLGGPRHQPPYTNGVASFEVSASPEEVLASLHDVEARHGRARGETWGARTIDLDLLLYGDLVLRHERLTLPHPRMAWRRFVLAPAVEVAADWIHPAIGWRLDRMLRHLETAPPFFAVASPDPARAESIAARLASVTGALRLRANMSTAERDEVFRRLGEGAAVLADFWSGDAPHASALPRPKLLLVDTSDIAPAAVTALDQQVQRLYEGPRLRAEDTCPEMTFEAEAAVAMEAMTAATAPPSRP